jgi:hypothetical protein
VPPVKDFQNQKGVQFLRAFLSSAVAFATCFVLQHLFTWKTLGIETLSSSTVKAQAMTTGVLADIWSGVVLGFLFAGLFIGVSNLLKIRKQQTFFFASLVSCLWFLSLHITYVEFFGAMISLRHFSYLGDASFAKASWTNLFHPSVLVATFLPALFSIPVYVKTHSNNWKRWAAIVFALGLLCQVVKVQLNTKKVGWRTPWILSVTSVEAVTVQLQDPSDLNIAKETPSEVGFLKNVDLELPNFPAQTTLGLMLKQKIAQRVAAGKPTYFIVALLESVRPLESRFFTPSNPVSFTPFLDTLAENGISFDEAYTSGGVTRAGQEAALCGLFTGEFTSAMRGILALNPMCLVKPFKDLYGERFTSAWWHGGDFNFDGQGTFWKRAGFERLTSREDFDVATTHGSFWGMSDIAVASRMQKGLTEISPTRKVQLHLFMSVTNHSDWGLPADAPAEVAQLKTNTMHVSHVSTRYTDEAMRQLVTYLRETKCNGCEESFWDSTIMIATNDHGNLLPSQSFPNGHAWDISPEENVRAGNAASKAALIVTGGIVEGAVKTVPLQERRIARTVSQIDIFSTLADFGQLKTLPTVGDSLFASSRRWPVLVDLGDRIYFPAAQHVYSRKEFVAPVENLDTANAVHVARAFMRAYQNKLLSGDAGRER